MSDHVHMMIAIPPKYAVSQVMGYIKGKSAIHLATGVRREKAEFRGAAFLGAGVLCVDGGPGRGSDPRVHPATGAGGPAAGSANLWQLSGPPSRWPKTDGAALATPHSRFERLTK